MRSAAFSEALRGARRFAVAPEVALFLCLFASQSGILVLSPLIVEIGVEFGVSTAVAGQVRTITGLVAGGLALVLARLARSVPLRNLLLYGTAALGLGSALSAASPAFWVFALAQAVMGAGVAILLSAGVAGAGEWAAPDRRAKVLSWALMGQAGAWIVGMPVVGVVAETSWRLAFVAVPLLASALAAFVLSLCAAGPPLRAVDMRLLPLLRDRAVGAWAVGELLAFSAWAGVLVYSGALFIASYDASTTATGVVLGAVALAYLPGTLFARRLGVGAMPRRLVVLTLAAAVATALFGAFRPALIVSALIFAALGFVAGARTFVGSAFGLDAAPDRRLAVMGVRTAATQFGYLLGAAFGGLALAASDFGALGVVLALLFGAAALPHVLVTPGRTPRAE